jgi:hypothetical protein
MENHPIPQDVTGFKFKLIGSVTVKQFLYILGGGILAAVLFMLPISALIKFPLCAIFGGVGVMLAFVPIDGRPMDVMIKNFARALPAENQFIYKKKGSEVLVEEFFAAPITMTTKQVVQTPTNENSLDSKRALLRGALRRSYKPSDDKEEATLTTINNYLHEDSSQYSASPSVQNIDAAPPEATRIASPTTIPQINISEAIKVVTPAFVAPPAETPVSKPSPTIQSADATPNLQPQFVAPPTPIAPPTPSYQGIQTPYVTQEAQAPIQAEASPVTTSQVPASPDLSVAPNQSSSVSTVAPQASLKAGFPQLPDTPNVVMGIIKDPRGKIIPNILVEIMDTQGIPVRAFKTNALGQFAAATPLPNGEYNVLLEDPRKQNEFEQIHISLAGTIFEPLEIISLDQREKLRRELFGANKQATA